MAKLAFAILSKTGSFLSSKKSKKPGEETETRKTRSAKKKCILLNLRDLFLELKLSIELDLVLVFEWFLLSAFANNSGATIFRGAINATHPAPKTSKKPEEETDTRETTSAKKIHFLKFAELVFGIEVVL